MPYIVILLKASRLKHADSLTVLDEGRVVGDRVLGFRFANSGMMDDGWSNKHRFIVLVNTPGIARLQLQFDHRTLRLCIRREDTVLVNELLDEQGRKNIAAAIENYVIKLDENPVFSHPDRLPLRLIGDGITPRYQDNEAGQITLHSRASLAAVGVAVGDNRLSELRFRSNIAIDGLDAWEEQSWVGRKIRIGQVNFDVAAPKSRCLATHANPDSGKRDLPILQTLTHVFTPKKPTFAVAMIASGAGGRIHVGDEVGLLN